MKNSFALLTTLLLVIAFSFISVRLVETDFLGSNLNRLKYSHLQATIYMDKIENYIKNNTHTQIVQYTQEWSDERFDISIIQDDINSSVYYGSIKSLQINTPVRLSRKIIK